MDKQTLVAYLTGLSSLMDAQDSNGAVNRSATLGREFQRAYAQLTEIIREEEKKAKENEDGN